MKSVCVQCLRHSLVVESPVEPVDVNGDVDRADIDLRAKIRSHDRVSARGELVANCSCVDLIEVGLDAVQTVVELLQADCLPFGQSASLLAPILTIVKSKKCRNLGRCHPDMCRHRSWC